MGEIAAIGSGIVNGAKGIFGSASHEDSNSQQTSGTNFRPEDMAAIQKAMGGLNPLIAHIVQSAGTYANKAAGNAANINTNFNVPKFGEGLDATAKNLMSTELGNQRVATETANKGISSRFANNPMVAAILKNQNNNAGKLQANPLAFNASQEQTGRVTNQSNAINNAITAGNNANVAQQGAYGNALAIENTGAGAQQNLLSTLLSLGQALGQQYQTGGSHTSGRSGGLF